MKRLEFGENVTIWYYLMIVLIIFFIIMITVQLLKKFKRNDSQWDVTISHKVGNTLNIIHRSLKIDDYYFIYFLEFYGASQQQKELIFDSELFVTNSVIIDKELSEIIIIYKRLKF